MHYVVYTRVCLETAMERSIKHLPFVRWILRDEKCAVCRNVEWSGCENTNAKCTEFIGESQSLSLSFGITIMKVLSLNLFSSCSHSISLNSHSHTPFKIPLQCWNIIKMLNARDYGICFSPNNSHSIFGKQFALLQPIPLSLIFFYSLIHSPCFFHSNYCSRFCGIAQPLTFKHTYWHSHVRLVRLIFKP